MVECSECNNTYTITDCFCRQCGNEHPDNDEVRIFSCDCGAQVFPEDNFCHACGEGFEGMEEVSEEDVDAEEEDDDDDEEEYEEEDEDGEFEEDEQKELPSEPIAPQPVEQQPAQQFNPYR